MCEPNLQEIPNTYDCDNNSKILAHLRTTKTLHFPNLECLCLSTLHEYNLDFLLLINLNLFVSVIYFVVYFTQILTQFNNHAGRFKFL